ncbi:hypothetical protein BH09BAC1_BH09BAC1_24070 [soil metagenome]
MITPDSTEMTPFKFGLLICSLFIVLAFGLPAKAFTSDMVFWNWWSDEILLHGIAHINSNGSNYPPLIHYFFWVFAKINGSVESINHNLKYVKLIPLAFDFIGALSLFFLMPRFKRDWFAPLFLLLNIAYLYNSYCWGQVDSIHTTLTLIAFIFALKERAAFSLLFFVLAVNMKVQAIIFLPLLGLLLLPTFIAQPKNIATALGTAILVQLLVLLPFILEGTVPEVWATITGSVDFYPIISMNAFNYWHLFFNSQQAWELDSQLFAGITYKHWGLLLFCLTSAMALFPLLLISLNSIWRKDFSTPAYRMIVFLSAGLIALVFFYFNTQMHERYSHPALIMVFIFSWYSKKYLLSVIVFAAYFLNMEKIARFLELENYHTLIFSPIFIALLYLASILLAFYHLYKYVNLRKELEYLVVQCKRISSNA